MNIIKKEENIYFIPIEILIVFVYTNIITFSYTKLHDILNINNIMYNKLTNDKQIYVLKNLIKCINLMLLSFCSFYLLIHFIVYDNWNLTDLTRIFGLVYGLQDTIALFYVPNMAFSTKIHHTCVTFLYLVNFFKDISYFNYWRGIVIYCIFSVLSGSVNGYLALRYVINENNPYKYKIKKFAYYNYLFCIIGIWLYQYNIFYHYLFNSLYKIDTGFIIYFIIAHLILYDDIFLMKFLRKYNKVEINEVVDNKVEINEVKDNEVEINKVEINKVEINEVEKIKEE